MPVTSKQLKAVRTLARATEQDVNDELVVAANGDHTEAAAAAKRISQALRFLVERIDSLDAAPDCAQRAGAAA